VFHVVMNKPDAPHRPAGLAALAAALLLLAATVAPAVDAPADTLTTAAGPLVVHPVAHASFLLQWGDLLVAVDPVGEAGRYLRLGRPQLVLVTHKHGDHFDADVLRELAGQHNVVVTTPLVAESVPSCDAVVLTNGESHAVGDLRVTAVPAYNTSADRLQYHPRGRDNGYLLERGGVRVYISGDTEDIPELADLAPVDVAFLCMNLPYTMSVAQAARAVGLLGAAVVYPYHFRNGDGSHGDVGALGAMADGVEVRVLGWY
jgi:L-ascorbate metabolism protein UlaG (beta-lactamase superfamily)